MFKKGFISHWKKTKQPIITNDDGILIPRPWQSEFYNRFINSTSIGFILNTPTGAGKSKAMCLASAKLLYDNPKQKILIVVPQKNIGNGFIERRDYSIGDDCVVKWVVDDNHNLCNDINEESKVAKLKLFLTEKQSKRIHKRIMVCTHQTLSIAFQDEIDISNTFLWIDEAHHVQTHEEIEELNNKLGNVVKCFLDNNHKQNYIGLVTATLFRGDSMGIVPIDYEDEFDRYSLPYDKHFEDNCQYLKSFVYDFLLVDGVWENKIEQTIETDDRTILFVPHTNSRYSNGFKQQQTSTIIKSLSDDKKHIVMDDVVITITRNGKPFNIINLVDDSNTKMRQDRLNYIKTNKDDVDMIIAMSMFTEGSDWDIANKIIIVGVKNSLTQQMQMVGRAFRDHATKDNTPVKIIQIVPNVDENSITDEDYQNVNDYMKCVYSSFIFEMMFNPVEIKSKRESNDMVSNLNDDVSITNLFDSDTDFFKFFDDTMVALIDCKVDNDNDDIDMLINKYRDIIQINLEQYNISDADIVVNYILESLHRRTKGICDSTNNLKSSTNMNASDFDYDCIDERDPMEFIRVYSTGVCGIKTLKDFRNAVVDYNYRLWNDMIEILLEDNNK